MCTQESVGRFGEGERVCVDLVRKRDCVCLCCVYVSVVSIGCVYVSVVSMSLLCLCLCCVYRLCA